MDDGERAEKASAAMAASPTGTGRASHATATAAAKAATTEQGPPPVGGGSGAASNKVPGAGTGPAPAAPGAGAGDWALRDRHAERSPDEAEPFRAPPPPPAGDVGGRRFTLRLAVFALAVVLVLAAAGAAVGFFARAGYYVGLDGEEVVIYKGRPGGLLWFSPTVKERTGVQLDDVRPSREQDLRDGKEEPSLAAAQRYVENIEDEAAPPTTTTSTTITTVPAAPPAPVPTAPTPAP